MPAKNGQKSVVLLQQIEENIRSRAPRVSGGIGVSAAINESLARYFKLLETSLRAIALSEGEWNLLRDVLNGTFVDAETMGYLQIGIEDSLEDGYGEKWNVDGAALVAKITRMTLTEKAAIVDAVERWWRENGNSNA